MSTREEFEKWAESEGYCTDKWEHKTEQYVYVETARAWDGWQAATRVEREACDRAVDASSVCFTQDQVRIKQLALKAIRARGDA